MVYSRAGENGLINRTGYVTMRAGFSMAQLKPNTEKVGKVGRTGRTRISVARLKDVDIMFYAIFLKESQF